MVPSKSNRAPSTTYAQKPESRTVDWRTVLAAIALCLTATRVLFPSESAATFGDGSPIVLLWVAAFLGWGVAVWSKRIDFPRVGWLDVAIAALVSWHTLSGYASLAREAPRPALNMTWEWLGMFAGYWIWRSTARSVAEVRAAVVAMVSLAVSVSALGLYQAAIELPRAREQFHRDPAASLAAAGVTAPPGSRQRALFEARMKSGEPTATFALTNSLAGFVAPWFVIGFGVLLTRAERGSFAHGQYWRFLAWMGALVCLGWILIMTNSRTAWLASGIGLISALVPTRQRWNRRALVVVYGASISAFAGAAALYFWRPNILSAALKSLWYRVEYWQATWGLIMDHPWLGCGPGNFQPNYGHYMLPTSSETVADPHNFLMEIWATAGTPAALAMLSVLACWIVLSLRRPNEPIRDGTSEGRVGPQFWLLLAGAAAYPLVFLLGPLVEVPLSETSLTLGLVTFGLSAWLLSPWVTSPDAYHLEKLLLAGGLALLVNLLAAGGIGFPSVAGSLWLILASTAVLTGNAASQVFPAPSKWSVAFPVGGAVLVATCYVTYFHPTIAARTAVQNGRLFLSRGDIAGAEAAFLDAARADPWSAEPWKLLAAMRFQVWDRKRNAADWDRFEEAFRKARALDPKGVPFLRLGAEWYLIAFRRTNDGSRILTALELQRRAVELHPAHLFHRAELAWLLHLSGDDPAAQREARQALAWDAANPHEDLALSGFRIFDPNLPPDRDAETIMRELSGVE